MANINNKQIEICLENIFPSNISLSMNDNRLTLKLTIDEENPIDENGEITLESEPKDYSIKFNEQNGSLVTKEGNVINIDSSLCFPSILEMLNISEEDRIKLAIKTLEKCFTKTSV